MAYDYPTEKLAIYLSDDGGSEFTFYALIEASNFAKHWLPFCRKFMVEPRSPEAYFSLNSALHHRSQEWIDMKVLDDGLLSIFSNECSFVVWFFFFFFHVLDQW